MSINLQNIIIDASGNLPGLHEAFINSDGTLSNVKSIKKITVSETSTPTISSDFFGLNNDGINAVIRTGVSFYDIIDRTYYDQILNIRYYSGKYFIWGDNGRIKTEENYVDGKRTTSYNYDDDGRITSAWIYNDDGRNFKSVPLEDVDPKYLDSRNIEIIFILIRKQIIL